MRPFISTLWMSEASIDVRRYFCTDLTISQRHCSYVFISDELRAHLLQSLRTLFLIDVGNGLIMSVINRQSATEIISCFFFGTNAFLFLKPPSSYFIYRSLINGLCWNLAQAGVCFLPRCWKLVFVIMQLQLIPVLPSRYTACH